MAKQGRKASRRSGETGSVTALAARGDRKTESSSDSAASGRSANVPRPDPTGPQRGNAAARKGFFDLYKPGQGYNTRAWSAVGYGALVAWFAYFMYDKFSVVGTGSNTLLIQVLAAVGTIAVFGLLGYWVLGLNKKVGDFLIATEGEMKKVNWTSRKDIIGSTKVVIFVVLSMAVLLFVVDLFFMAFFNAVGVLKGGSFLDAFKGVLK